MVSASQIHMLSTRSELLVKLNGKLESMDEDGVTVEYQHVERNDNKDADKLLRAACR
jgi:hypothetical protein